jgi:hypothetical protein
LRLLGTVRFASVSRILAVLRRRSSGLVRLRRALRLPLGFAKLSYLLTAQAPSAASSGSQRFVDVVAAGYRGVRLGLGSTHAMAIGRFKQVIRSSWREGLTIYSAVRGCLAAKGVDPDNPAPTLGKSLCSALSVPMGVASLVRLLATELAQKCPIDGL